MGFGPAEQKQVFSPCLVRSPLNHLGEKRGISEPQKIRGKTPCLREETVFGLLLCQYFAELDAFLSWMKIHLYFFASLERISQAGILHHSPRTLIVAAQKWRRGCYGTSS